MTYESIRKHSGHSGIQICEENLGQLVSVYKRDMLALASRTTNHFVTESSEEWSVILQAFYEAVKGYESSRGTFWGFASLIMRRRLTDYIRRMYRDFENKTVSEPSEELPAPESWPGEYTIRDELDAVQGELKEYRITFLGLTETSPKAKKTRKKCITAIATLMQKPHLTERLFRTKTLPVAELALSSGVSKKTIERHRNYIVTAAVILAGEYPMLAEYLHAVREEIGR